MNAHTMMNYKGSDGEVTRQATPLLHTVTNAEEKRHIIGDTFVNLATDIMQSLQKKSDKKVFLAQGTYVTILEGHTLSLSFFLFFSYLLCWYVQLSFCNCV